VRTREYWGSIVDGLDFAFQPIVNIHTGACYGYEALLRGTDTLGFDTIHGFFDAACDDLQLHGLDLVLRAKAVAKFMQIAHHRRAKLFYNMDGRVLEMPDYKQGYTGEALEALGLNPGTMCFEVSERHDLTSSLRVVDVLGQYRSQGFKIALDDYGCGHAGLELLYHSEPDFIKIDRFFIDGIARDSRKRLFVSNVIAMAHLLGISVICEGVESLDELRVCREAGCDFVQGYLIQRPTVNVGMLLSAYPAVLDALPETMSGTHAVEAPLAERMEVLETLPVTATMHEVLVKFRASQDATFWVITDQGGEPLGLLRERSIRQYIFSPYGWALLAGSDSEPLEPYISKCPIAEIHMPVDRLADMFAFGGQGEEGVILTDNGVYAGFVRASEIVNAMHSRDVAMARDQNPLTGLPGNNRIGEYIRDALADGHLGFAFVYFDFDGFKAFNDTYGFRRGDRAIQLFADILRSGTQDTGDFVGHVGGDDFFVGIEIERHGFDALVTRVWELMDRFRFDSTSLLSDIDVAREGGTIRGLRAASLAPALSISAAVVHVPSGRVGDSADGLGALIATLKASAKRSATHIATLEYGGSEDDDLSSDVRAPERAAIRIPLRGAAEASRRVPKR
jgi:diguanylate cyclase (GGDEF)-like protein